MGVLMREQMAEYKRAAGGQALVIPCSWCQQLQHQCAVCFWFEVRAGRWVPPPFKVWYQRKKAS